MKDTTPWLTVAQKEIGVKETPGKEATPRIMEYHAATTGPAYEGDETAWCAAFVSWCLEQAGVKSLRTKSSRAYEKYGTPLANPVVGCIVIFPRGDNPKFGHVAFVTNVGETWIDVLGGNQGNKVSIRRRVRKTAVAFRMPPPVQH